MFRSAKFAKIAFFILGAVILMSVEVDAKKKQISLSQEDAATNGATETASLEKCRPIETPTPVQAPAHCTKACRKKNRCCNECDDSDDSSDDEDNLRERLR